MDIKRNPNAQNEFDVSYEDIEAAKNAISSAFPDAQEAELAFQQTYQEELEQLEQ